MNIAGSVMWQAFKGPIEIIAGLLYGCLFGYALWHLPHHKQSSAPVLRFVLLLTSNLLALFGSVKVCAITNLILKTDFNKRTQFLLQIGFSGAGPISCLVSAFVAGIGWRKPNSYDHKPWCSICTNGKWWGNLL